jgi:hypothetical protein
MRYAQGSSPRYPGPLHHVMIRGIERRRIFNDDKDHENLIERWI